MHRVQRWRNEPTDLVELRGSGSDDFGTMGNSLRTLFSGVCAYCERGFWREQDRLILGMVDADFPSYFTCDHFEPRHRLCFPYNQVGQCADHPPPHARDCPIYDWDNLVYCCNACNLAKGGQWPQSGESADEYVDPCAEAGQDNDPERVFVFDVQTGRISVHHSIVGTPKNNAQRTIDDLALNLPRGPKQKQPSAYSCKERKENLSDIRRRYGLGLRYVLDNLDDDQAKNFLIARLTGPDAHFSSFCKQLVNEFK